MTSRPAESPRPATMHASRLACVLSCALIALVLACSPALADVRASDMVSGAAISERGFTTALCPSIEAEHAVLVDDTGKVYYERDGHGATKIASVTKVMTAIVAMEYDPGLDLEVRVTDEAAEVGESSANLAAGDTLDLRNALTAMMVASGNDAAESIATSVGAAMLADEGTASASDEAAVARFVEAMNAKAQDMGLEDTLFTNPHGLDDGDYAGDQHSTAYDVAAEVALAMQNDDFRDIVGSETATVELERDGEDVSIELTSTDELLGSYEGTVGVKTGFTDLAGACFAGANDHDGREYYAIVLDSPDEAQRFLDAQALWNWCYQYRTQYRLANAAEAVSADIGGVQADYPVLARVAHLDWTDVSVAATIADPDQAVDVFSLDGNVSQEAAFDELHGDIHAGDRVGQITFKQRNEEIATVELVAAEDVAAPNPVQAIGIWWQRLWGNDATAQSVLLNETPLLIDKTKAVVVTSDAADDAASDEASDTADDGAADTAADDDES